MIRVFSKNDVHPWRQVLDWQKGHPYGSSFIIALLVTCYFLFSSPALQIARQSETEFDPLSFLDVEMMPQKELNPAKEVSVDPNAAPDVNNVQRATGVADWKSAVDTDFYPSYAPPRPVNRFKRLYPKSAQEKNIEANISLELLIDINGKVKDITIHGIKITTKVPAELEKRYRKDFAIYARKILVGHQFTPFIMNGKRFSVRQPRNFEFRLPK